MNLYATLEDVRAETNRNQGTADNAMLLRILERVSRSIDEEVGYPFYAQLATKVFDGNGLSRLWMPVAPAQGHLLTVTALTIDTDDDGTYELEPVEGTDYRLWPLNRGDEPAWAIEVLSRSNLLTEWPRGQANIRIEGVYGYSYEVVSVGTLGAQLSDSSTTATMTAGHSVKTGHTLKIESEQLYVEAVATNTLTVRRAMNGTTAAVHASGTAVSARRYPRDIESVAVLQAARFAREAQTGYSGAAGGEEFAVGFGSLYPAIRDMIKHFKTWHAP